MGDPTGFMKYQRAETVKAPIAERVGSYGEFERAVPPDALRDQGARCMDCGVPFCHGPSGCPLGNLIPVWNDHVYRGRWEEAIRALHATNNFPEFTGRICPAPCETACVLGINEPAVTIKQIEVSIVDRAFAEGWIVPEIPARRTGKRVAVVGSGPAGLACAHQLNRAGHNVVVFERADRPGGLLAYGIPDFKLEKTVVARRVDLMRAEGIEFRCGVNVGLDVTGEQLRKDFDAVVLCGGSTIPRDLDKVPGRDLKGVHFAMDFLTQQNRRVSGLPVADGTDILAKGKHVVVIGGGDTGSDCIGTSIRQGAESVMQFEVLGEPPATMEEARRRGNPWPYWPVYKRTSSSQAEMNELGKSERRRYSVATKEFLGENGHVTALRVNRLEWKIVDGRMTPVDVPGSEEIVPAGLVLLAMGFLHPQRQGLIEQLGVKLDERGNVAAPLDRKMTSVEGVFAAGDMRRGQSLVVWAIAEGRDAAFDCDEWLMGRSELPRATPRG